MVESAVNQNDGGGGLLVRNIGKEFIFPYGSFQRSLKHRQKHPGVFLSRHPLNCLVVVLREYRQFASEKCIHISSPTGNGGTWNGPIPYQIVVSIMVRGQRKGTPASP